MNPVTGGGGIDHLSISVPALHRLTAGAQLAVGYYYDGNSMSGGTAFATNCNFMGHRLPESQASAALWVAMSGDHLDAPLPASTYTLVGRDRGAFTAPASGDDYGWDPTGAQFVAPEDGVFSVTAACQLYSSTTNSIARYTRLALVDENSDLVVRAPPQARSAPLPAALPRATVRGSPLAPTPGAHVADVHPLTDGQHRGRLV